MQIQAPGSMHAIDFVNGGLLTFSSNITIQCIRPVGLQLQHL